MIDFVTLGAVELRDGHGAEVRSILVQPKRIALLSYLALQSQGSLLRREELLGILWPESDPARARSALRNALHHLRSGLGADALISRGHEEVGINGEVVRCDAVAFERELEADRLGAAMALYKGSLLPGFAAPADPGFEHWLERRRAELRRRAVEASRTLAERAEAEGEPREAVRWAWRATEVAPYDEPALRRLLAVLDRAGDRAGLLRAYNAFAQRLADDFEAAPAPETQALFEELSRRTTPAAPVRAGDPGAVEADETAPVTDGESGRAAGSPVPAARERTGGEEAADARGTAGRLPSTGATLRSRPSGAGGTGGGRRARWAAAAAIAGTALLVAAIGFWNPWMEPPGHGASPGVLTDSPEALRAYRGAEAHARAGRYQQAVEAFQRAVVVDSGFAWAYHRLSMATDWTEQSDLAIDAAAMAFRHRNRLSPAQRLAVEARRAYVGGRALEAERITRAAVTTYPAHAGVLELRAEVLFHWGPQLGYPAGAAREAFERVLKARGGDAGAFAHLARLAAHDGGAALDALEALAPGQSLSGVQALELRALRAFATRDGPARERIERELRLEDGGVYRAVLWAVAVHAYAPEAAKALAARRVGPVFGRNETAETHLLRAYLDLERGRRSAFDAEAAALEAVSPGRAAELRAMAAAVPFWPASPDRLLAARRALGRIQGAQPGEPRISAVVHAGIYPPRRLYLEGVLALRARDTTALRATLDSLDRWNGADMGAAAYARRVARLLRAEAALASGRPLEALKLLEPADFFIFGEGLPDLLDYPSAAARWLRVRVLEAAGQPEEALRWLEGFPDPAGYDLPYLAQTHYLRARILERLGRRVEAAHHYDRFLRLWSDADAGLQPRVAEARGRLMELRRR